MDPESPPPIINGDFLRTCLLYEYLKNQSSTAFPHHTCYIAAVNMSQMFVSESIRNNIPRAEDSEATAGSAQYASGELNPMFHARGSHYSGVPYQEAYELGQYTQFDLGSDQQGSSQQWSQNLGEYYEEPADQASEQNLPRPPKMGRGQHNPEEFNPRLYQQVPYNPGQGYPGTSYQEIPPEAYDSRQDLPGTSAMGQGTEEPYDPNQPGPSDRGPCQPGHYDPRQDYSASSHQGSSSEAYYSRRDLPGPSTMRQNNEESYDPNQPGPSNRVPNNEGPSNPPWGSSAPEGPEPSPEDFFPEKTELRMDQLKSSPGSKQCIDGKEKIQWETRTEDNVESFVTPLKLLKQGEEDIKIDIVSTQTIHDWFYRFDVDGKTITPEVPVRKTRRLLREVRSMAYTIFGPTVQESRPARFKLASQLVDDLKITIGFGSIKMEWAQYKSSDKKLITLEYWRDNNGCWLWNNDGVRFIKGFKYELLACHEFINIVRYLKFDQLHWNRPLHHLEFEFERQTKWKFHVTRGVKFFFVQKIKDWMEFHNKKFPTCVFTMTLYEEASPEYQPFPISLLANTETIRLRVWKGAKVSDNINNSEAITVLEYLEEQAKAQQWGLASELSMQDEKLATFTEANFSGFERIYSWDANVELVRGLIQQKLANFGEETVLRVHQEFRTADFHEALGIGNFESLGVFVEKGERGTIRVTFDEQERKINFVVS